MTSQASGAWPVSAYIPCYNNAGTIALAIEGIRNQTHPVDEIFVVDDGSADNSAEVAEAQGVRVIRLGNNMGRGAARARAMEEARNEFVLCGDATNQLAPNFLDAAMAWFSQEQVIAVYGRCYDRRARNMIDRWRARHLYKQDVVLDIDRRGNLSTFGAIVRKSAVLKAGNYNHLLRHGEDYDLGERLLAMGDVIADPTLEIQPVVHNTLFQVMERFARWNRASITTYDLSEFIRSHVVAWRILIPKDIAAWDIPAALISATLPYFSLVYADRRSFSFHANADARKLRSKQRKT